MKNRLRVFLYVDRDRVESIASQIFEGVTESLLREKRSFVEELEAQKGPLGSGWEGRDNQTREDRTSEFLYVHDYMYTKLEKELLEQGYLHDVEASEDKDWATEALNYPILKIRGCASIIDVTTITNAIKNYPRVSKALNFLTNPYVNTPGVKKAGKAVKLGGISEEYLKEMEYLFSYGFQDQLMMTIHREGLRVTAVLRRDMLREKERMLLQKFSRNTERELVAVGWVTQSLAKAGPSNDPAQETESLKEKIFELSEKMEAVDYSFSGRLKNEMIFDPIAIYIEL